jgi:hypothetical protein
MDPNPLKMKILSSDRSASGKSTGHCGKTRLVLFTCIKSMTDLELVLLECDEMVGRFREIFSKQSLLFVAENWDATFFRQQLP